MNTFGSKEFTLSAPASLSACIFSLHYTQKNKLKGHENKKVDPTQQTF